MDYLFKSLLQNPGPAKGLIEETWNQVKESAQSEIVDLTKRGVNYAADQAVDLTNQLGQGAIAEVKNIVNGAYKQISKIAKKPSYLKKAYRKIKGSSNPGNQLVIKDFFKPKPKGKVHRYGPRMMSGTPTHSYWLTKLGKKRRYRRYRFKRPMINKVRFLNKRLRTS